MTIAYFDCFAGAGGDMIVASLVDAGCDFAELTAQLKTLNISDEYDLEISKVYRKGIGGSKFDVHLHHHEHEHQHEGHHHHHHRHLSDITALIESSQISPAAKSNAVKVFKHLAQSEAMAHNCPIEKVHFHEVGAVDSIIDIVAACIALDLMGVEEIYCAPIPLGSGTVECEHGIIPVPAPATVNLLRGVPTTPGICKCEMTTPTAAAIFTTLSKNIGPMPQMTIENCGYGAGTRETTEIANLLRVFIGTPGGDSNIQTLVEMSANIDDCSGEIIAAAIDALITAGALDAWAQPIIMKKTRPAWKLCVLCQQGDVEVMENIIFHQTTTFGIRRNLCTRSKLERKFAQVETPYGQIRIKLGVRNGEVITASPEFSDCDQAAKNHHVAAREVFRCAEIIYESKK